MSDWGGGYVTDIAYMPGYYRQQSPALWRWPACWAASPPSMPAPDDR